LTPIDESTVGRTTRVRIEPDVGQPAAEPLEDRPDGVDRVGVFAPLVVPVSIDKREPQRHAAAIQLRALEVHAATSTGMGALASCAAVLPRIALLAPRPRRPTTRS
jgi:hypothetical protein